MFPEINRVTASILKEQLSPEYIFVLPNTYMDPIFTHFKFHLTKLEHSSHNTKKERLRLPYIAKCSSGCLLSEKKCFKSNMHNLSYGLSSDRP